jgi:hypothetical protein
MAKKALGLPAVSNSIYELLEPLETADRLRAINAALTLLGDNSISDAGHKGKTNTSKRQDEDESGGGESGDISAKGRAWMRKYKVSDDQVAEVFDLDGETAEVIADDVPGDNSKIKTINAYVVTGIAQYLKTGDVKFNDDAARAVCKHMGCLNETNHSKYMSARKNLFNGSKKAGWKLTAPGLKKGAELVAGIVNDGE